MVLEVMVLDDVDGDAEPVALADWNIVVDWMLRLLVEGIEGIWKEDV